MTKQWHKDHIAGDVMEVIFKIADQTETDGDILYGFRDSASSVASKIAKLSVDQHRSNLADVTPKITAPLGLAHSKHFRKYGG